MRTLRNLHHVIPLNRRVPTHPVSRLSAQWLKVYPNFCPLVLGASTFNLFATEWYRNAETLRAIQFNFSRRVDSNETLPDSGGHFISKKIVCSRRIGIASGRRKSVWSILSTQPALRWPQHNDCILVRWVQYNPHPVRPVHQDGPFHTLISRRNPM